MDTAKSVFHLISKNTQGRILNKKKLKRAQVLDFFANLPPSIVVMEACGSSHYWCRGISRLGHEVKAIPPQYVVPYRKGNKPQSCLSNGTKCLFQDQIFRPKTSDLNKEQA